MRRLFGAMVLGIAALACRGAAAESVVIGISATDGESTWTDEVRIEINPDGTFAGQGTSSTDVWSTTYIVSGDADPIVNAFFSTQNLAGVPLSFTVTTYLPVAPPVTPASKTSGSVGYTVTDGSLPSDGATVATLAGSSLYTALIDGSAFMTLLDDPTSIVAAPGGSMPATASFGLPGQTVIGPAISTSMEVVYEFSLTPQDQVAITGNFVALVVPEPTTWALGGIAGLALVFAARRRTK